MFDCLLNKKMIYFSNKTCVETFIENFNHCCKMVKDGLNASVIAAK